MQILAAGNIKRIHVDRRVLAQNRKSGDDEPAWTIQTSRGPIKARQLRLKGPVWADQRPKQLPCGARMYLVTRGEVQYA